MPIDSIYSITVDEVTAAGKEVLRNTTTSQGAQVGFRIKVYDLQSLFAAGSFERAIPIAQDDTGIFTARISSEVVNASNRNEQRIADFARLQKALESYYRVNGRYPYSSAAGISALSALVTGGFIPSIASAPSNGIGYAYSSRDNGAGYILQTMIEIDSEGRKIGDPRLPINFVDGYIRTDGGEVDCNVGTGMYCVGVPSVSGTVSPMGANKSPILISFTGPDTAWVGQAITWTILANDPDGDILSYDIYWGDEPKNLNSQGVTPSPNAAYSHTYAYPHAGTYTVEALVRDTKGNTARTERTVFVR